MEDYLTEDKVRRKKGRNRKYLMLALCIVGLLVSAGVLAVAMSVSAMETPALVNSRVDFPSNGSILEFFDVTDGLQIKWYHGANSLAQMEEALQGDYMMLEGDIHLRWYGFPNQTDEPVMTHDPGDSDNTLDNWLNNILARTDKGPKLDFKSMEVVEPSLKILSSKEVNHPVWINADIVRGPGGIPPKFDPDQFLGLIETYFPAATLSLGWTTSCCFFQYTPEMMDAMYDVTTRTTQPVTFPARAALLKGSWDEFRALLQKDLTRFSITVWTPSGRDNWEGATPWDMIYVRNDINKSLIHYDLPGQQFQDFQRDAVTTGHPLNHFPSLTEWDSLNVTWAHAVNSHAELEEAIESDIMMLEADVLLRGQDTENETDIPIMAHPPDIDSDITLEEWVEIVSTTGQGIKLDFKSEGVLEHAMKVLQKFEYSQPVWLNADILSGPGSSKTPINADEFKRIINEYFPACTWSIGWTTGWTNSPDDPVYTEEMIDEMLDYVADVKQPITYPIRASMVARSWPVLKKLLDASRAATITVWSSASDEVDVDGLVTMREESEPHRIYYDLPDELMEEFLSRITK